MAVDLNTASRDILLWAGLTAAEVKRIQRFRTNNAVFHSKAELKKHCGFSRARYKEISDQLTTHCLQDSPYNRKVEPRKYRRQRGDMRDDWDVGHIIARANAGADHSANYVPMSRAYNQKLRHLHDGVIFAHLSKKRVREAVHASRVQTQCPLTFNKALKMKRNALHNIKELKLFKEGKGLIAESSGGVEAPQFTEACLCDAEYCEQLIREWEEHYNS